ncbi:elongin A, like isoform X1 [Solea solea]|uniref:elongin A, like isoform X1 n=1 Tax=Solea solea TaxID=90069 RepID=UPI00272A3294|nr:elongin A, like isoform X1 [Solea solea]
MEQPKWVCEVSINSFCFECTISNCADPKPGPPYLVLKVLQKLKDLDINVDILAETGIGKTVNSLRRHEQAGEFAKTLVRGWKKLLSKEGTSLTEDGALSETMSVKDKQDNTDCPNAAGFTTEDLNNNWSTCHSESQDFSDEAHSKTGTMKDDTERRGCKEKDGKSKGNRDKIQQETQNNFQSDVLQKKTAKDEMDGSPAPKKTNCWSERKLGDDNILCKNKKLEDLHQRSRSDSGENLKINFGSEKESSKKSRPSKDSSKEDKESFLFTCNEKYSKTLKLDNFGDEKSSGISRSSEVQKKKKKKMSKERHGALKQSENEELSQHKNKKAKMKHRDKERDGAREEPSKSFESCLNYDVNARKRKKQCGAKKTSKKFKTVVKEGTRTDPDMEPSKLPVLSINASPPNQKSVMDLMGISLPAILPECEKQSTALYFDRKVEKDLDFYDDESAVFTGQRLNKKMQVYSGAKMVFLPTMLSLYQQCIRTLQNNINLLYETGGVPFEILEPVLERCMPEQLLRIEECNPIYIGVTDHLWGKHCQREFKDSQLQEYESWKEMYIRLSEERERKLQRLTKSIVSAHSNKPKGRQVKMAFIHTVAKPPRDVRIQQEIHGTAVQQPNQLRCSVKPKDIALRPSCNEPSRSSRFSSSSSGGGNSQESRKKTRVAPMMAKSLKAFKKQLGRR